MSFAGQEILRQITKSVISSDQVALIIVDMQRGFMPGKDTSELPVPDADTLIEPMNMLIQAAQDAGVKIIYTADRHTPHSPSFFTTFELEGWAEEHGSPRVIYRGMIPAYIIENVKEENFNLYPLYSGSGKAVAQLLPDELQKMEACLKEPVNEHTGNSLKLYPSLSPIETFADSQHYLHEKASGNYV